MKIPRRGFYEKIYNLCINNSDRPVFKYKPVSAKVDENGCPSDKQGKNTITKKWALCKYKINKKGMCYASESGCPTVSPQKSPAPKK